MRRLVVAALAGVVVLLGHAGVKAQDFPSKSIRLLQGFPAGGNADILARSIGDEIAKSIGQSVIAEAKPGASGNLATLEAIRSTPDGHTLVQITTAHVISPALMKTPMFDPLNDLEFVSKVADFPFFIAVHKDSPYKTINELIAAAKEKPGALTWGSAGTGSGQHMCGELMALATGTKTVHVPFRGDAGSVTSLLSKSIDYIVAPSTVLVGNIDGGNFRALAVSSKRRAPGLPDVPTLSEALKLDIEMEAFQGIVTTKGTPKPVVDRLVKEVHAALKQPSVIKRLSDMGGTPAPTTSAEMRTFVAAQLQRWKDVVAKAGIKAE